MIKKSACKLQQTSGELQEAINKASRIEEIISSYIEDMNIEEIIEESVSSHVNSIVSSKKYGVSGVGGSSTNLTRIWDSEGLVASIGSDSISTTYKNDFDEIQPFCRKKCVGSWSKPDSTGISHFNVNSYYGDPDYTEDGTMGDYVAVEVEPLWYYQDLSKGILGVSNKSQPGWDIHPICLDSNGNIRRKTYLPCYNIAIKEGKAVSLPGLHPYFGNYKELRDTARTYGGGNTSAYIEPVAVRHYEWLLFTIEYATTDCKSIMSGASYMLYGKNCVSNSGNDVDYVVVPSYVGDQLVIGQTIVLSESHSTTHPSSDYYNIVTDISTCNLSGNLVGTGSYRRISFNGTKRTVSGGTTTISSRPWITGSCNSVLAPTGSPVNALDGRYPMMYRWRENLWGNAFSTCNDLFCVLEYDGFVRWYSLVDDNYYPTSSAKPDTTEISSESFRLLSPKTENVSGYISSIEADVESPEFILPTIQTGASSSTYFSDYTHLALGDYKVHAVLRGGHFLNQKNNGILSLYAKLPPSSKLYSFTSSLYFKQ